MSLGTVATSPTCLQVPVHSAIWPRDRQRHLVRLDQTGSCMSWLWSIRPTKVGLLANNSVWLLNQPIQPVQTRSHRVCAVREVDRYSKTRVQNQGYIASNSGMNILILFTKQAQTSCVRNSRWHYIVWIFFPQTTLIIYKMIKLHRTQTSIFLYTNYHQMMN